MALTFLQPNAGWLFLLLPVFWWLGGSRLGRTHRALRLALFAALIVALMQPSLLRRASEAGQVVVLDQGARLSAAGQADGRAALGRVLRAMPAGARVTLVQIGGTPVNAPVDRRVMLDGASLSTALERALDAAPLDGGGAITLISDGLSTDRHWGRAIAGIRARGIAVNAVSIATPPRPAFVSAIDIAPTRVGEAAQASIAIDGVGRDLTVTLYDGTRQVAASPIFAAEGSTRVALSFPAERAGFVPLRAVLSGTGAARAADFTTVAAIQDPLRLLYLGNRQTAAAPVLQRLLGRGVSIDARQATTLTPGFDFSGYAMAFVDDLPAADIAPGVQRALTDAVSNRGLGLLYSGGQAAFGMGGYDRAPLAAALPVTFRQERRTEEPSVALAIVIDSSGSMIGDNIDLAKQVARFAVRPLTAADNVGVVEFYGGRQWVFPMQPARAVPEIERAISRVQAQGETVLFPALEEAYFALKNVDARYKHILLLSDGGVEDDKYQQLIRQIAQDRIAVSTVLVGGDPEGEARMSLWARVGRGRYYAVPDEFSLVQPEFKDPQSKPQPGYRSGSIAVRAPAGASWWPGMTLAAMPPLDGYARVGAKPRAETLVQTAGGDPILSSWQYGAGRVTALMTEPVGAGTRGWLGWRDYGAWVGRVVARTADQQAPLDVLINRRADRATISVQRLAGGDDARPELRLTDQAGRPIATPAFERKAPGLFVADLAVAPARDVLAEVRLAGATQRAADRASSDVAPANRIPQANMLPLAALAGITGGSAIRASDAAMPAIRGGRGDFSATALWSWFCLMALALYVADITYRRWPTRRPRA